MQGLAGRGLRMRTNYYGYCYYYCYYYCGGGVVGVVMVVVV